MSEMVNRDDQGSLLSEPDLVAFGRSLGARLAPGAVVWLEGDLGTGKTTLVKAMAAGLGVSVPATSPSYTLVHRYQSIRGPVYHVDCFRLRDPDEARDLDWEGLHAGAAVLIEWPERAGGWPPPPTHRIRLSHVADPRLRRVELVGADSPPTTHDSPSPAR